MKNYLGWLLCLASTQALATTQPELNQLGRTLIVSYQVQNNIAQVPCSTDIMEGKCFTAQLTLSTQDIPVTTGTSLYFSHMSPIADVEANNATITVTHINGDLHRIDFLEEVNTNTSIAINIKAPFWHASRSDVMPNYYLVSGELEPVVIDSTRLQHRADSQLPVAGHALSWTKPEQYRRNKDDALPFETARYDYDQAPAQWTVESRNRVIPQVVSQSEQLGFVNLTGIRLPQQLPALLAWQPLLAQFGLSVGEQTDYTPVDVRINGNDFNSLDAYRLTVSETGIAIEAASEHAAGYALITLAQLVDPQTKRINYTHVDDSPRFDYRGVHIDIARNFNGKQVLTTIIEQMAILKLNKLHLHISDDEGWRLEIPGLPELTDIGAYRCHDLSEQQCLLPQLGAGPHRNSPNNGYLTIADYQQLLVQANNLGIEVIPSFDMPGHVRAAVKSMQVRYNKLMAQGKPEQARMYLLTEPGDPSQYRSIQFYNDNTLNPCVDSTYRFLDKVLNELKVMHAEAGVPLRTYHMGADETAGAWTQSPACLASGVDQENLTGMFIERVVKLGNRYGLTMAGWSDGMDKALPALTNSQIQVNVWDTLFWGATKTVSHWLHAKVPTVLSLPDVLYFDFPYQNNPLEPGYYWAAKSVSLRKVFEFMPEDMHQMAQLWTDRMGNAYEDSPVSGDYPIAGMQSQLWTEVTRTPDSVEYMLFPRLLAFAERAWHQADWEGKVTQPSFASDVNNDYASFAHTMATQHYPRLIAHDINVRVPPPGVKQENEQLFLRALLPNLALEYSPDGVHWHRYSAPLRKGEAMMVRARVLHTDKTSRVVQLDSPLAQ